jgi:hypothetical protein
VLNSLKIYSRIFIRSAFGRFWLMEGILWDRLNKTKDRRAGMARIPLTASKIPHGEQQ